MKKQLETTWPYLMGVLVGSLIVFGGLAIFATALRAATYNTFFNNVEQGANSTANPTLNVSDAKAKPIATSSEPAAVESESAPKTLIPTTTAQVQAPAAVPSEFSRHRLRFGLLANSSANLDSYSGNERQIGGSLSATYFVIDDLGLSAFGGMNSNTRGFFGGELEVVPIHVGIFGLRNLLEVGLLFGTSNLGTNIGTWGSLHGGARLSLALGERFGLSGTVRTNLSERNRFQYVLAEAGLTVRL